MTALISLGAFLVAELWVRSNLQYNDVGQFFDEEHVVVYHEQALPIYWAILLIVVVLTGFTIRWSLKTK